METEPGRRGPRRGAPRLSETASAMVFARQLADVAGVAALRSVTRIRLNAEVMRQPQVASETTRLDESRVIPSRSEPRRRRAGGRPCCDAADRPGLMRIAVEAFDRFLLLKFEQRQPERTRGAVLGEQMSEGALRALGILVAAQQMTTDELLIIEEPESRSAPALPSFSSTCSRMHRQGALC